MDVTYFLPVLYAFVACLGFGGLYNLHGRPVFWAAVGGALGWLAYLLTLLFAPDLFAGFVSAAVVAFYAEVLARLQKRTVTTYLLIGIIPMVPGAGIYHTMEYCRATPPCSSKRACTPWAWLGPWPSASWWWNPPGA